MANPYISIVIALYNKWELTKQCLTALSKTIENISDFEIITIDNASSDETPNLCESYGKSLFGNNFQYLRQEENRNFSGANNIGAKIANGKYLFLLNNDTIAQKNWYNPLISALKNSTNIGAVGPLLLYPKDNTNIMRVQHAGVTLSLDNQVSHIYELFPPNHHAVQNDHDFQVITGAALMIEKNLYQAIGGLDEKFINGFEDVDLCARLCKKGFIQKVISSSKIIHLASQSPGRGIYEEQNSALCKKKCSKILKMDEHILWEKDGYTTIISPWIALDPTLNPEKKQELLNTVTKYPELFEETVYNEPYWDDGYQLLAKHQEKNKQYQKALNTLFLASRFKPFPDTLLPILKFLQRHKLHEEIPTIKENIKTFLLGSNERIKKIKSLQKKLADIDLKLHERAQKLLKENDCFYKTVIKPLYDFCSK